MEFYNATALAVICADVFGPGAWNGLDAEQRAAMLADVEAVDAEYEEPSPRLAARVLRERIGGSANLDSYARCLVVGARRRAQGGA